MSSDFYYDDFNSSTHCSKMHTDTTVGINPDFLNCVLYFF